MLDPLVTGFLLVFQWPAIGFMVLGVLIGIWLGAVPGLGGILGLILLLPFTFDMEPVSALALLLGMFAVTSTSDTIASVMLGIPGTAASQATILDGYPLAQKGQADRAFGAAYTVSAFGGVFGALVLALSLPLILPIILAFGSPELFMLGVLGLTMVGTLAGRSIVKGLAIAALGLLFSTVGYSDVAAIPRFWFGTDYLIDSLPLLPVVLGLFAIPELMELATRDLSISRVPREQAGGGGMRGGIKDAARNWWLATRCAAIGTYIGVLPGLGAAVVDWIAYGHAVQSTKGESCFGRGDIRGVIAPEAANNATRGGALLPTLAFGIPGSLGAAILLEALLIQGLRPGPEMLTTNLHITYSLVWTIVIANILVAILLMFWTRQVAKLAFVPGHLIVPGVILFVFMGAWLAGASIGDWITCFVMGVVGYVMKRGGWPRPPLILAFVLGGLMENTFQISLRAHDGAGWLGRPIVVIFLIFIVATVALTAYRRYRNRHDDDGSTLGEGAERNTLMSWPLGIGLLALFGWTGIESLQWQPSVGLYPLLIAIAGGLATALAVFADTRGVGALARQPGGLAAAAVASAQSAVLGRSAMFFGYLLAMVAIMPLVGQKIAIPVFIVIYLVRWGGYGWRIAAAYAVGGWLVLVIFYDRILHLFWYPSRLASALADTLPGWLPAWLFL